MRPDGWDQLDTARLILASIVAGHAIEVFAVPFGLLPCQSARKFCVPIDRCRLESGWVLRRLAQVEQQAIGGAARGYASDRLLR
jgi:hypothetical protein